MKLSVFVCAMAWASIFADIWICILQNDWAVMRMVALAFFLVVAFFAGGLSGVKAK